MASFPAQVFVGDTPPAAADGGVFVNTTNGIIYVAGGGKWVEAGHALRGSTGQIANAPQMFAGTGAPTFSAPKGSVYSRVDGSSTATRLYVNTDGAGTWTNVTTAG